MIRRDKIRMNKNLKININPIAQINKQSKEPNILY